MLGLWDLTDALLIGNASGTGRPRLSPDIAAVFRTGDYWKSLSTRRVDTPPIQASWITAISAFSELLRASINGWT
jgi:hypothetical protein